jgi:hypothetical protein
MRVVSCVYRQLVRFVRKTYHGTDDSPAAIWPAFEPLAALLYHLSVGHFIVVLMHQAINPLLDSFF